MAQSIGFVGLGIMGSRMAANLRKAGFHLSVWNRTTAKAKQFASEHDAVAVENPSSLAAQSDVVVTMVVDAPQVERVLLGPQGVAEGARDGLLCCDMSTIGPSAAIRIAGALHESGIGFVDAPVSGSSPKAEDGTLTIMAGGEREHFERALPLLEAMGELVVHVGPVGHGQMIKVINNAVAAINAAAVGEALLVGKQAGLDLDALVGVISAGSGASAMLDLKAGPMRSHDYTALFKLEHMLKDLRLCLQEAEAAGIGFGFASEAAEILQAAADKGLGGRDFAALIEVLE